MPSPIVIARSEATKQSFIFMYISAEDEIATPAFGGLAVTEDLRLPWLPLRETRNDKEGK